MKKSLALVLVLGICMSMCIFPAGAIFENETNKEILTEDEFAEFLTDEMTCNEFGGLYYDGDTLIVNIVDSQGTTSLRRQLARKAMKDVDVEYRMVAYSLSELEGIKDFLTDYMYDYGIVTLDANEVTNQVDICLKDYSEENVESIKAIVLSHGGKTDYLNFINNSDTVILSTVGHDTNNTPSAFPLNDEVASASTTAASTTRYLTGGKIYIGNGSYTLGPALSSSKAYSAGHEFSGTVAVNDSMGLRIGSATSHYGGSSGDWSKITMYNGEFFPVVGRATPTVGKRVYMFGATSGETTGKITQTNVSVAANPPYATLTGMCAGSYECDLGDSGAGLFDCGIEDCFTTSSDANTYGIQSSGLFYVDSGEWAGTSYFTPISKVS